MSFHCGTMDKTEQEVAAAQPAAGDQTNTDDTRVDTPHNVTIDTNNVAVDTSTNAVVNTIKNVMENIGKSKCLNLDGTESESSLVLCNGVDQVVDTPVTLNNGIDSNSGKQENGNNIECSVKEDLTENSAVKPELVLEKAESEESVAVISQDVKEETETNCLENKINGAIHDEEEIVKEPDKVEVITDNIKTDENVELTSQVCLDGTEISGDVLSDLVIKEPEVLSLSNSNNSKTDVTESSSGPPSLIMGITSDESSVNSDANSQEEPMETENTTVEANDNTNSDPIDNKEVNPEVCTSVELDEGDKSMDVLEASNTEKFEVSNTEKPNEPSLVVSDGPKVEPTKVVENSECKNDTKTPAPLKVLSKGQKLDQLLSKISTKAESQKTSAQPKPAKARKSCASSTDNSLLHSNKPSLPSALTSLTFNVKELEKKGVLDIPKPKPSKRKAFEPIKIPSPDKDKVSNAKKNSPLKSPVKSPGKNENPFFNKQKIVYRRKKKGKRSGGYRLPGEKVFKRRTKTSEERQLTSGSDKEPSLEKDNNSDIGNISGRGASLPVNTKHPKNSRPEPIVEDTLVNSDNKVPKSTTPPGQKNALDILSMNSRKSFSAGMNSGMKKAKKTVRHGIDPATHRTLDSFLKSGSHSKKLQEAQNTDKTSATDRLTESYSSDQRKRKAHDSGQSKASSQSPDSLKEENILSPEEKKRKMQQSPQQQNVITLISTGSPPLGMPNMAHPMTPATGSPRLGMPRMTHPMVSATGSQIILSPGTSSSQTILTSPVPAGTGSQIILSPNASNGSQTLLQNGSINGIPMFQIVNSQGIACSQTAQFVIAQSQALTPGKTLLTNTTPMSSTFLQPQGVPVIFSPVPLSTVVTSSLGLPQQGIPSRPSLVYSVTTAAPRFQSQTTASDQAKPVGMSSQTVVQQHHSVLKNTLCQPRMQLPNGQYIDFRLLNKNGTVPNGLYPVTPPRTPEEQRSDAGSQDTNEEIEAVLGSVSPDKDVIPLCTCKISGASFQKMSTLVTFCQALDSVDGKVLGCCIKVNNPQLVRPAVKIPFLALCDSHRKRLRLHQCCPGCGHFCSQGKFLQCKKEGSNFVHHFHEQCQITKDGKNYCPHCGETSHQYEVKLTMPETKAASTKEPKVNKQQTKARIGVVDRKSVSSGDDTSDETNVTHTLETSKKVLSTAELPAGPDKYSLERVLSSLTQERPKKYRHLPKCLYTPAYDNDLERVVYMLEDGHDPNELYSDIEGQSALHAAAAIGSLCIVHVLIQAGASPHHQDNTLRTPLMFAAENNHADVVKYLIKANAIIDAKADDGMTALHYAAKAGHVNVINILLETDQLDIDTTDDGGWTPLIWAVEHMEVEAVKLLLKRKADPNLRDTEENTTMHWAAFSGSVTIAELLLAAGCDLDSLNMHGDRPLHIAARQDHYECVVLFLARGADVEARNNKGETPLECCIEQNTAVYVALKVNKQLKSFGAKHMKKPDKLIHRDLSKGRENIPIPCVNGVDNEGEPRDYLYVTDNVETTCLNINRVIGSLQTCQCKDDCSSIYCACGKNSIRCWYDKYNRLLPEFNMIEPPLIFECNRACECWTTCNNRVVQNGVMSRLQVFKTVGRGWGCKTLVDIARGTFICEYIGEHISDSEADRREDDSYLFDLDNKDGETYCIDARRFGNVARFINHLCEPNLTPVKVYVDSQDLRFPRICLFANRDIKAQEELGFDYGEKFWIIKWKQFTCTCGSQKCRYSTETIQKTLHEYRQRHELDPEEMPE